MTEKIDVTGGTFKDLALSSNRIAQLLVHPKAKASDRIIGALDDLLGAVYSLIAAHKLGYKGKVGRSDYKTVLRRAEHVALGEVRHDGNWMAGFHFNSALSRLSAIYDRLPQAYAKSAKRAALAYKTAKGSTWADTNVDAIRQEVIKLKHRDGTYPERKVDMKVALLALSELLDLAETLT